MIRTMTGLLFVTLAVLAPAEASALITGGEGNQVLMDPGWPKGAAAIVNHRGRIAFWVGPPLGGGQWHAECRGDAKALNAVLVDFAKLDVKTKRVVVHDDEAETSSRSARQACRTATSSPCRTSPHTK